MPDSRLRVGRQVAIVAMTVGDVRYWLEHVEHLADDAALVGPVLLAAELDPEPGPPAYPR